MASNADLSLPLTEREMGSLQHSILNQIVSSFDNSFDIKVTRAKAHMNKLESGRNARVNTRSVAKLRSEWSFDQVHRTGYAKDSRPNKSMSRPALKPKARLGKSISTNQMKLTVRGIVNHSALDLSSDPLLKVSNYRGELLRLPQVLATNGEGAVSDSYLPHMLTDEGPTPVSINSYKLDALTETFRGKPSRAKRLASDTLKRLSRPILKGSDGKRSNLANQKHFKKYHHNAFLLIDLKRKLTGDTANDRSVVAAVNST